MPRREELKTNFEYKGTPYSAATSIQRSGRKPESVLVKKLLSTTDVSCLGNAGNVPAAPIFSGLLQALDMYSAQEQTDYTCETDPDDRVELSWYQHSQL